MRGLLRDGYITTILMLFILLFFIINVTYLVTAEGEQLYIDTDVNEIEEGKEFLVYVYIFNETGHHIYQTDVELNFNNTQYQITGLGEYPEVSTQAPSVDKDEEFTIAAEKEGYNSTTHKITVLN